MKAIINGLLYDTEKAEVVCEDSIGFFTVYKTKNNRVFIENKLTEKFSTITTDMNKIKEILGSNFPDKYIELFGEVEEA